LRDENADFRRDHTGACSPVNPVAATYRTVVPVSNNWNSVLAFFQFEERRDASAATASRTQTRLSSISSLPRGEAVVRRTLHIGLRRSDLTILHWST